MSHEMEMKEIREWIGLGLTEAHRSPQALLTGGLEAMIGVPGENVHYLSSILYHPLRVNWSIGDLLGDLLGASTIILVVPSRSQYAGEG